MRITDHHQSCCPFVGFGEIARTPRAETAERYHPRSAEQAAGRRGLEPVVTGWRVETRGWNSAGRAERGLRHRIHHLRTTTGEDLPRERPNPPRPRAARG